MNRALDITLQNRKILQGFINNLSLETLNKVPKGFNNSLIWNIAHTVVTQQLLVYKLSNLPMLLPDDFVNRYKKGTQHDKDATQADVDYIKSTLFSPVEQTNTDYNNGVFKNYTEYTVSTGSKLTNVDVAFDFNNFHEGIHLGYILALKKAI